MDFSTLESLMGGGGGGGEGLSNPHPRCGCLDLRFVPKAFSAQLSFDCKHIFDTN